MRPAAILETILYANDLAAAEAFYANVLGLEVYLKANGRQVFFRCGRQMLLIFDPAETEKAASNAKLPVPSHGARGPGHVCFAASRDEIDSWRERLTRHGVVIEADFEWPSLNGKPGGRSIYFRDPAGNSVEFAEPRIWKL